jgi:hypothetical protein
LSASASSGILVSASKMALVIPMCDSGSDIRSLQFIDAGATDF